MCRSEPPTRDDLACRWRLYRHRARHFPHLPTRSVGPVSAPHAHRPVRPGAFLNRITPSRWCLDAARDPAQQRRTGTSPGSPQNTARLAESHAANPTRGGTPGEVGRPQQRVHPGNVVPGQHRPRHRPIPQLRPRQPVPPGSAGENVRHRTPPTARRAGQHTPLRRTARTARTATMPPAGADGGCHGNHNRKRPYAAPLLPIRRTYRRAEYNKVRRPPIKRHPGRRERPWSPRGQPPRGDPCWTEGSDSGPIP